MTKKPEKGKPAPPQEIDEAGEESFPASDPPAWTTTHAGSPAPSEAKEGARPPKRKR